MLIKYRLALVLVLVACLGTGIAIICKALTVEEIDYLLEQIALQKGWPNSPMRDAAAERELAQAAYEGIDPKALMAIAALETHLGTDPATAQYNQVSNAYATQKCLQWYYDAQGNKLCVVGQAVPRQYGDYAESTGFAYREIIFGTNYYT